jgi:LysW-gamma-L-lysine carboxypeptidase
MSARITPEQAVDLLTQLVAIPSPSCEEAAAAEALVAWMQAHGYHHAYRDETGSAIGIRGTGSTTMVLLGHIDTFGGFPPVRREGTLLYGRGTVDAKGPLATFAAAAAQAALPDDVRVIVVGAVEEEAPSSAGAHAAVRSFAADACIIGEPSQWDRMTLGYKGRLVLEWMWRGALAHSASQVLSPAEHAFAYWQRVTAYADAFNAGRSGLFNRLDATIQELNTAQDGAMGTARMVLGFRLPPDLAPHQVAAALAPENDAVVRAYGQERAFVAERDNALTRALRGAIRAAGGQPAFVMKTGTSDMNIAGPAWGCPIVAYGPGSSALDHTPDEHIDLEEYLKAITVLTTALERLQPGQLLRSSRIATMTE